MRHFDDFVLDETTHELFRHGTRLKVPGKAVQLLVTLTDRPGVLLSRRELHEHLWPGDTFVDFDNNLNVAVRRLREALGDSATAPRYIETLPRRGHRFICPLTEPAAGPPPAARWHVESLAARRAAAVVGLVLLAAALSHPRFAEPPPVTVAVEAFRNLSGDPGEDHVAAGLMAELAADLAAMPRAATVVAAGSDRAHFVVRGTSRRDPSGLYVTAALVDLRTQEYVWSESFTCPRQDLFAVQRQMAAKIGDRLRTAINGAGTS